MKRNVQGRSHSKNNRQQALFLLPGKKASFFSNHPCTMRYNPLPFFLSINFGEEKDVCLPIEVVAGYFSLHSFHSLFLKHWRPFHLKGLIQDLSIENRLK